MCIHIHIYIYIIIIIIICIIHNPSFATHCRKVFRRGRLPENVAACPATRTHGWSEHGSSIIPSSHAIPQDLYSPCLSLTNSARTMFTPTMLSLRRHVRVNHPRSASSAISTLAVDSGSSYVLHYYITYYYSMLCYAMPYIAFILLYHIYAVTLLYNILLQYVLYATLLYHIYSWMYKPTRSDSYPNQ